MQKLKTILVASVVAASLFAAAGTAGAQTETGQRGTSWTAAGGESVSDGPVGASWELLEF